MRRHQSESHQFLIWTLNVQTNVQPRIANQWRIICRVFTKSLFSKPVFQYKHFLYKFSSLLNLSLTNICWKYCIWLPRIFLYGKCGLKKRDRYKPLSECTMDTERIFAVTIYCIFFSISILMYILILWTLSL